MKTDARKVFAALEHVLGSRHGGGDLRIARELDPRGRGKVWFIGHKVDGTTYGAISGVSLLDGVRRLLDEEYEATVDLRIAIDDAFPETERSRQDAEVETTARRLRGVR